MLETVPWGRGCGPRLGRDGGQRVLSAALSSYTGAAPS